MHRIYIEMRSFRILNFGCRANQADGAALRGQILDEGWEEAASTESCQVALLNSCTVTATADAELRQVIRRIHRRNPSCKILITGCYAQRAPEELAQFEGVQWVVGDSHKHKIRGLLGAQVGSQNEAEPRTPATPQSFVSLDHLRGFSHQADYQRDYLPLETTRAKVLVGDIFEQQELVADPVYGKGRTRPTLKIQDGCNARCAYCIIPYVRGRSRSLAPEKVLDQVRRLQDAGYQEIVLSGINLGSYGKDLPTPARFLELLHQILSQTTLARLRISSIEPMDVSGELIDLIATERCLAKHFHIPLQSGCDGTLRRMNRRYWASQYAERITAAREKVPEAAIGADVMVGFPGETTDDHHASACFIESLPFTYLHVFPYSAREGTPAARSSHPVNGRVARERSREIRSIITTKQEAFLEANLGRILSVLSLEETNEQGRLALSSNYLKVILPGDPCGANRLLDVRVVGRRYHHLFGKPLYEEARLPPVSQASGVKWP